MDGSSARAKGSRSSFAMISEPDSMTPASPVTAHFHSRCKGGPFINSSKLPSMVTAPNHQTLAKLCLQEVLAASKDHSQLSPLLFGLEGDVHIVTAAGKNFTVKIPAYIRQKGNNGLSEFLETLCTACRACRHLITLEPGPEQCDACMVQSPPLKRPIKTEPTVRSASPPPTAASSPKAAATSRESIQENPRSPSPKRKAVEQETATSTTNNEPSSSSPAPSAANVSIAAVQPTPSSTVAVPYPAITTVTTPSSTVKIVQSLVGAVDASSSSVSVSAATPAQTPTPAPHLTPTADISPASVAVTVAPSLSVQPVTVAAMSVPGIAATPVIMAPIGTTVIPVLVPVLTTAVSFLGTSPQMPRDQNSDWTIEDVIKFIAVRDPTLAVHVDLLRKHRLTQEPSNSINTLEQANLLNWKLKQTILENVVRTRLNLYGTLRYRWPQLFASKEANFSDVLELCTTLRQIVFFNLNPTGAARAYGLFQMVYAIAARMLFGTAEW